MSRVGSSSIAGTNKRPRLVSHKSGSPATVDTSKQEHESAAQQTASASERHFYAQTALGEVVDRAARAALARFTFGFSPAALAECYLDFAHLASSPGKQPLVHFGDFAITANRRPHNLCSLSLPPSNAHTSGISPRQRVLSIISCIFRLPKPKSS